MKINQFAGVLAGFALVLAACGGDDDSGSASADPPVDTTAPVEMSGEMSGEMSEEASPVTTAAATTAPLSDGVPQAIISLSPTATEMLYAIGAGDQVLAVDDFSNFPPETADKMSGISGFEPNVESLAGLEPDLIVTDGTNPDLLAQLDTLAIAHWEGPAAAGFDDVYTQIEQLGVATGHVAEAAELVGRMQAEVDAVRSGLPDPAEPLTYYHELDDTYFSATSDTFIGAVYAEIGLVNIADAAAAGSAFPQLSAEYIIEQDPDIVFLACTLYCGLTADSVAERPGWESMTAVATGSVIEMNDDVASRWGPRIVDYLRIAGDAVADVAALQPAG